MADGDNLIIGSSNSAKLPTTLDVKPVVPKGSKPDIVGLVVTATKRHGVSVKTFDTDARAVIGDARGRRSSGIAGFASDDGSKDVDQLVLDGTGGIDCGVFGDARIGVGAFGTGAGVSAEGGKVGVIARGSDKGGVGLDATGEIGVRAFGSSLGAQITGDSLFIGESLFVGTVTINGGLAVVGFKAAAVRHPDDKHRLMYSLECPESWFEDFGRGTLRRGRGSVKLDPRFAAIVRLGGYHVFVMAEGDCEGLYVSRRGPRGFEVRECKGGRGDIEFSYRVVARRKDVAASRMPEIDVPEVPARAATIRRQKRRARARRPRG